MLKFSYFLQCKIIAGVMCRKLISHLYIVDVSFYKCICICNMSYLHEAIFWIVSFSLFL